MSNATLKQPSKDEANLRAMIADWSKALEDKNIDGLAVAHSPDVLLFDVKTPFQIKGIEAYRKTWEQALPCFPAKYKSERRDLTIAVDGNVAFMHCLHRIKPTDGSANDGQTWIRVTACYRKIEGKWQATHEHVSIPFDPKSGKVVLVADPDAQ